jgi:hypothetical protein
MTEDEAKTKRCCGNRAAGLDDDIDCIASRCMAWRWIDRPVAGVPSQNVVVKRGDFYYPDIVPAVSEVIGDGYCGLAGPVT